MSGGRPASATLAAITALLILAQLAASAISIGRAAPAIFQGPPARTVTAKQQRAVRRIRGWIPETEPLLYLSDTNDAWLPRVWERALGPEPVAIVMSARAHPGEVARLRKRFRIRWALSTGAPPLDPGFAWRVPISMDRRTGREYWFGELAK
ncbi:MAG TPA: hypothetical protein VFL12_00450 [Thermoanaerobaculia bacterium]|nr:hypothetical protein [Thermoanaerobaculia bacterium]